MRARPLLASMALLSFALPSALPGVFCLQAKAQERPVRIGLYDGVGSFTFSAATEAEVLDAGGHDVATVLPRVAWEAHRASGERVELSHGNQHFAVEAPVRVVPRVGAGNVRLVYVGSRWYRGLLEIRPGLVAINELPLEEYLYGVVPSEMPHRWPIEALKAQAVAARTYTLANLGEHASHGYDLIANTDNQAYGGATAERPETNMAVDATRGEVLTYDGKPIAAYYCSAAGGYTDGADTVWLSKPVPYLQPVPDFDQAAPSYRWLAKVPERTLEADLAHHGVEVGKPVALDPLSRGYSGRVKIMRIVGTNGRRDVSGEEFRYYTGLKSSLFNVAPLKDSEGRVVGFAFAGRGHGHGLGLSQWGARGLGEMGYKYTQILAHYYPSTELTSREAALP